MTIEVKEVQLIYDIRSKSHLEVKAIADLEARYDAEAGSDKLDELRRCIQTADGQLRAILSGHALDSERSLVDTDLQQDSTMKYVLDMDERRWKGKATSLKNAIHSYLVDASLAQFYSIVSQADLATKHAGMAEQKSREISKLIYTRSVPVY